jgi:TatD DNase family protein
MIDFHCHLDLYENPAHVMAECKARAMYVLAVTTTPSAWLGNIRLVPDASRIRIGLGLHPQLAHQRIDELPLFDQLLPRVRFVGEIGLDGSPEYAAHWADQLRVLDHILKASAAAGGRILSIHSRRATGRTLQKLEEHRAAGTPILHWFSGSQKELEAAVALGCWFSVGPAMTRTAKGKMLISLMPKERILTETDGPFAAIDGVRLFPWDVARAICDIAALWGVPVQDAERQLVTNLRRLLTIEGKSD